MSLQSDLIEKIKHLPENKQLLVKSLVDELARASKAQPETAPKPWLGCLASQHPHYGGGYRRGTPRDVGQLSPGGWLVNARRACQPRREDSCERREYRVVNAPDSST